MKHATKRFISVILCVLLVCNSIPPSLAVGAVGSIAQFSIRTDTSTLSKTEIEQYYSNIMGLLNVEIVDCEHELEKSVKDAGAILSAYAKVLILADSTVRSYVVEENSETNLDTAIGYTIWDIHGNIKPDITNADGVEMLNKIQNLHEKVSSCDVFCSDFDWGQGKFKELGVGFGARLTVDGSSISTGNRSNLIGSSCWSTVLNSIAAYFIEGKIASILIANEDKCASLRNDTSTPANKIMSEVINALEIDATNKEEVGVLLSKYKDSLTPYIEMYNEIKDGLDSERGRGLENFEYDNKKYVAYHISVVESNQDVSNYVSDLTKTMRDLLFSNNAPGGSTTTDFLTSSVDARSNALALMTNCILNNGTLIKPTDGSPIGLRKIGHVIVSAGVVHDPFVSHACDDAFIDIVRQFLTDSVDFDNVRKVLQVAANTKKPLYVTEGSKSKWKDVEDLEEISMADYEQATLQDVLEIDKDATKAYVVLKGQMMPSSVDASTWEYANHGTSATGTSGASSKVEVYDSNQGNTTVGANTTEGVVAPSESMTTVGTNSLQASAYQVTKPLMFTSGRSESIFTRDAKGFPASVGGMTSLIIHNAAVDAKGNEALQRADRELLFVNGLGDIVLADNTIILPAIANPLLYTYVDEYTGKDSDEFIDYFIDTDLSKASYYPYTAAFMNHYPTAHQDAEGKLDVSSANDLNKFIICVGDGELYAKRIKSVGENAKLTATGGVTVCMLSGSSFCVDDDVTKKLSGLSIAEGKGGFNWQNASLGTFFTSTSTAGVAGSALGASIALLPGAIIGGVSGAGTAIYANVSSWGSTLMITKNKIISGGQVPFFPLNTASADVGDSFKQIAGPLTTSALRYISTTEEVSGILQESGKFRVEHYIVEYCAEALMGTQYAETLDKNFQVSYDDLVKDSGNRFLRFISQICESAVTNLGRIDGVLSIKGPYSNNFFNVIVRFIQKFYLLIAIVLMIIVAVKFMKGHYNIIYVTFLGIICVCGFEVYANWLPTMIPGVYNFLVNDAIEDIIWSTVMHQAEQYDETYKDSSRVDPATGYSKPYTATITLYTLSNGEMDSLVEQLSVTDEMLRSGTQIFLDVEAGIFVQGNQIKMSVDKLLVNNTMRGLYQSQWKTLGADLSNEAFIAPIAEMSNDNPYSIQLTKPYVSLESYYTPYDHIERAFMINLNTFSNIFRIEQNQYSYDDGKIYKDAFLVQAFIHSGIFTAPGDDAILKENIVNNSVMGETGYTYVDILSLCNYYFELSNDTLKWDWLNLRSIFENPAQSVRNSLWGRMMQNRGWYDYEWNMTEVGTKKISELIDYINLQTKLWIIRNEQQINYLSDENAIKMISLYATTCFTHQMSEFGNWLYPNYVNASDIELQDVLYGSMTTLRDRNHAYDGDVVNTVALNNGLFGVVFLMIIVIASMIFIFVITYLIPILYALVGIILVFKLINDIEGAGLIKGYMKVTVCTSILYFIFSLSMKLVRIGGYNWYGYLGCALVVMLCVYFLFWIVMSVIQDVGELGNSTLKQNLLHGLDKLTRGAVQKLTVNTTNMYHRGRNNVVPGYGVNRFGRRYNIDNYDMPLGSRFGYSAGSNSGPDDSYRPNTLLGRFGRNYHLNDDFGFINRGQGDTTRANNLNRRGWFNRRS